MLEVYARIREARPEVLVAVVVADHRADRAERVLARVHPQASGSSKSGECTGARCFQQ